MLRTLEITGSSGLFGWCVEQEYSLLATYEAQVGAHICHSLLLDCSPLWGFSCVVQSDQTRQTHLGDFYMSVETRSFTFQSRTFHPISLDRSALPLATLFNPAFRSLSLHKLTTLTLSTLHESAYSLLHALQFIPPTVHHLTLDRKHSSLRQLQIFNWMKRIPKQFIPWSQSLLLSHWWFRVWVRVLFSLAMDSCDGLMDLLQPLLYTLTTLEIRRMPWMTWSVDAPFGDEQVQALFSFMEENHLQLKSLDIQNEALSDESIHLMALMAPSEEESRERNECRSWGRSWV